MPTVLIVVRYLLVALLFYCHIYLYGWLDNMRNHRPASKSLARFFFALLALLWLGFAAGGIVFLLTGINVLVSIGSGLVAGIGIAIVVEFLWSFIAPDSLPNLEEISEQMESISRSNEPFTFSDMGQKKIPTFLKPIKKWWKALQLGIHNVERPENLRKIAGAWVIGIPILFFFLLVAINHLPTSIRDQSVALVVVYFLVFTLLLDFVFTTYHMANRQMTESVRMALFIKALRDTFPGFILTASLFWVWKISGPGMSATLAAPGWWFGGLVFMFLCGFLIPLQYQSGVTDARKTKERVISECVTDLDVLITKLMHVNEENRKEKILFILGEKTSDAEANLFSNTAARDHFSIKNVYDKNPATIRFDLLNHIHLTISHNSLPQEKWGEHFLWLRETIEAEAGIIKSARPLVSEWLISILTIIVSTVFTKFSENILAIFPR